MDLFVIDNVGEQELLESDNLNTTENYDKLQRFRLTDDLSEKKDTEDEESEAEDDGDYGGKIIRIKR